MTLSDRAQRRVSVEQASNCRRPEQAPDSQVRQTRDRSSLLRLVNG